jgi:hypothetical protein
LGWNTRHDSFMECEPQRPLVSHSLDMQLGVCDLLLHSLQVVEILNALPPGTLFNVKIVRDQGTFVTKGKVIYVHERIGMGVAFVDPTKDQLEIVDSWLVASTG